LAEAVASGQQWSGFQTVLVMVVSPLLVAGAAVAAVFWKDRKRDVTIQNRPLLVAMEKEFASRHELERHIEENKKEHQQFDVRLGGVDRKGKQHLDEKVTAIELKRDESHRRIHSEVNDLRVKVGQLETETKNQTQQLNRMDQKLDALMQRSQ
jgi:hypothetical protein